MSAAFESLCSLLEDECERQENILAVCRSQGEAARNRDVAEMEAKTAALELLLQEVKQAEDERNRVARLLSEEHGVPHDCGTLSELIRHAPEAWRPRLRHMQARLRGVLDSTRQVVRANAGVMRHAARKVSRSVGLLTRQDPSNPASYTAAGMELAVSERQPVLMDQRG